MRLIPRWLFRGLKAFIDALVPLLVRSGISPNALTALSFLFGAAAGALIALELPVWALAAGTVCAILDGADGRVAAATKRESRFGAMLDSTLDRYAEFFIFGGVAAHFRGRWPSVLALFALMGALMVSYTRARAEGLGFDCRVGWMQRPERFILFGIALLVGLVFRIYDLAWIVVLSVIGLVSNFTAFQRLHFVRKGARAAAASGISPTSKKESL